MTTGLSAPAADLVRTVTGHRSIRKYRPEPVDESIVQALIACAQAAPTSSDKQAYSVIRVTDPAVRRAFTVIGDDQEWIEEAPLFLVWCADLARIRTILRRADKPAAYDNMEEFLVATIDATLAASYAYLTAELLGLGGCMIGGLRNDPFEVARLLRLPELVAPLFGMCLGWPDEHHRVKPRLPGPIVLHEETYDPTAILDEIADYDVVMNRYYGERESNQRETTWTSEMARKFAQPERPHMRRFLDQQGFRFEP
jgi:FMN reductase (NADPH)